MVLEVVEKIKKILSLKCQAGFDERTATKDFKECPCIIDCSREFWTMYSSTIQLVFEEEEGHQ
jgi:hypothetical protein